MRWIMSEQPKISHPHTCPSCGVHYKHVGECRKEEQKICGKCLAEEKD